MGVHTLIAVGEKFSKQHVFTEDQVRAFASAAGDTNPLHHDAEVAAASRYKKLIASGTHTTALMLGLVAAHFSRSHTVVGVSFTVDLRRPVFADAVVLMEWEVVATPPVREGVYRVELRGTMHNEKGALCLQATGVVQVNEAD